jgi:hypothetical protein
MKGVESLASPTLVVIHCNNYDMYKCITYYVSPCWLQVEDVLREVMPTVELQTISVASILPHSIVWTLFNRILISFAAKLPVVVLSSQGRSTPVDV